MVADERYRIHNELVNKVLLFVHRISSGLYWGNPTGAVKTENGHFQRYGLVGSTDIIGFTSQGRAVFIEIKTGSGKLSPQQKKFKAAVELRNCIHITVYDDINEEDFRSLK